jgi:glycine cleavage system H protein
MSSHRIAEEVFQGTRVDRTWARRHRYLQSSFHENTSANLTSGFSFLLGIVGITQKPKKELGPASSIDFSVKGGDMITAGRAIAFVGGKTTAQDVFSPVSGRVVQVNQRVEERPSLISEGDETGWLVRIQASDFSEIGMLMSEGEYEKFCKG